MKTKGIHPLVQSECEVLVIGAGIAGCVAAISLADRYSIILIDKLTEPVDRIGESLAPAARRILNRLDLYEDFLAEGESMYVECPGMRSYWGDSGLRFLDHLYNPDGSVLNLNRKSFEVFLRKKALERGVRGMWPVMYYSSRREHTDWQVIVRSHAGDSHAKTHGIRARFVIDATGRQSRFARSQGIFRDQFDSLISCWASLPDGSENRMSTISSEEKGWWYSAPVPGSARVMSFQTDPDLSDRRTFSDPDTFISLVRGNREMSHLWNQSDGPVEIHGIVSANSTRLQEVAGDHWVAVGDAAMSFDPLSSQGMFHAMASAMQFRDLAYEYDCIGNPELRNVVPVQREYTRQMDRIWQHYRMHQRMYYRSEMRWEEQPFWKRRNSD